MKRHERKYLKKAYLNIKEQYADVCYSSSRWRDIKFCIGFEHYTHKTNELPGESHWRPYQSEKQLKENNAAVDSLLAAYKNFDEAPESVIGTADSNSKIVLDALPSKYDFPALATSLEKLLISGGFSDIIITGSDNEATAEQNSTTPAPIEIPFTIAAKGTYTNLQMLIDSLRLSIRPFKIMRLDITASSASDSMSFAISAVTFYHPEKNLEIPLKEVE